MKQTELTRRLLNAIPELTDAYKELLAWWGGGEEPGQHVIFGDVLNPFLLGLLESMSNEELLIRVFNLLDTMAIDEDIRVKEVVVVTVLERLGDDKVLLERARLYMKPNTRKLSDEVEKFWGRVR